jgi:hypothetical protein
MIPMGNGSGTINGYIAYYSNTKSMGEPVPGAEVYIEQEPNDQPLSYSETDTSGFYQFDSVAVGNDYHLFVDIPGFPLISTYTDIDVTNNDTLFPDLNFYVDTAAGNEGIYTDSVTYVKNENFDFSYKIYPNPFTENINIEYITDELSNVEIELYDINGRVLYNERMVNQNSGHHSKIVMVDNQGTYFVKLRINKNVIVKKVISVEN